MRAKKFHKTIADIWQVINFSSDDPTAFYRNHHNHIPPWILFKNIRFTTAIDLYSFLKEKDKTEIVQEYVPLSKVAAPQHRNKLLKDMLSMVRKFRNKIAHNSKFVSFKTDHSINSEHLSEVFGSFKLSKYIAATRMNDIFSFVLSLSVLMDHGALVKGLLDDIVSLFEAKAIIAERYRKATGLPEEMVDFLREVQKYLG